MGRRNKTGGRLLEFTVSKGISLNDNEIQATESMSLVVQNSLLGFFGGEGWET